MSSSTDPAGGRATWPDRVGALLRAALALRSELELDGGLGSIVESAAHVASARYAALGIYDDDGEIARFVHYGMDEETVARIGRLPQGRGLLGEVIVAEGPIRRDDIAADPRSCGFPPNHPSMHSFLGVPDRPWRAPLRQPVSHRRRWTESRSTPKTKRSSSPSRCSRQSHSRTRGCWKPNGPKLSRWLILPPRKNATECAKGRRVRVVSAWCGHGGGGRGCPSRVIGGVDG